MSERKVLSHYYPNDFDPSLITRSKKPKGVEKKLPTVRLMAPFPLKCRQCGGYVYRGRKFNAKKETTDTNYLNIPIYRFHFKCPSCSSALSFTTDPKNMGYQADDNMQRNAEPWRATGEENANKLETEDEMLDRLEAEAAQAGGVMQELEQKVNDARTEMEIADALDEIRTRNARIQRAEGKGEQNAALEAADKARREAEREKRRVEAEDDLAAKRAFGRKLDGDIEVPMEDGAEDVPRKVIRGSRLKIEMFADDDHDDQEQQADAGLGGGPHQPIDSNPVDADIPVATAASTLSQTAEIIPPPPPPPSFKRAPKKKKDFAAALGIKKKPALV